MEALTYHEARAIAAPPVSRFALGSPCRFIPRVDFTCHLLVPAILRSGDVSQGSCWDRSRVFVSRRLNLTSPRWKGLWR